MYTSLTSHAAYKHKVSTKKVRKHICKCDLAVRLDSHDLLAQIDPSLKLSLEYQMGISDSILV